jgi:hypothetical protein
MFKAAIFREHCSLASDESDGFRAAGICTYWLLFYSEFYTLKRFFNTFAILETIVEIVENYRIRYQWYELVVLDVLFYDVVVNFCDACLPFDESSVSILTD